MKQRKQIISVFCHICYLSSIIRTLSSGLVCYNTPMEFKLISKFKPTGDQPQVIKQLTYNIKHKTKNQVLLGVTGSGKTFTMANVIANIQKPTLIISHNKTLAGQLYQEFRDFFPQNAVSYFVSYYDYYQPEAYVPQTDTYIEKEAEINEEIDKLRLSATANLLTRKDVIVVASVSCIYNLGSPVEYGKFILELRAGMRINQRDILIRLTDLQYNRNDYEFKRGTFRVRGNSIDLFPAYVDFGIKMELSETNLIALFEFDPLTGEEIKAIDATVIFPAKHFMTNPNTYKSAFTKIKEDLDARSSQLKSAGKLLEAQRLTQRTNFDLEMIREVGYVNGIENYSSYFDNRLPGDPPYSLIDYFEANNKDWLLIVDESHITIPQIRGMYLGDRSRKQTLIDYGFRLPSALENRPLRFDEFMRRVNQAIYVSATPNDYELSLALAESESTKKSFWQAKSRLNRDEHVQNLASDAKQASMTTNTIVELLIRPTGLVDPQVSIRKSVGQITDLIKEIQIRVNKHERVLVTTLTKRMAEELTTFLEDKHIKVTYLHSDIETLNRQDVLDNLRSGKFDVLIGINLLREGLDLPEVSLVVILDADKEGFLRSKSSLIQTMGRAARHINSKVILYADTETKSIKDAIAEVNRRRNIQLAYNAKHNITPLGIEKEIRKKLIDENFKENKEQEKRKFADLSAMMHLNDKGVLLPDEKEKLIKRLRSEMRECAKKLDFETAAIIRDQIKTIQQ
jgi:excinuclease ABC subunit B